MVPTPHPCQPRHHRLPGSVAALSLAFLTVTAHDLHWPEFRGPRGDGTTTSTNLPVVWSETNGVRWKLEIPGRAWSSPVIWDRQLWLTTATEDGRTRSVLAVDTERGRITHNVDVLTVDNPQFAHKFNTHASPTPAVEKDRVYVSFGAEGIFCLDTRTARVLWQRLDFKCNHFRGAGSSPILWNNLLFLNFDGSDHQFIVALDKQTGTTVWRRERSIDFKDLRPDGKPDADGDWRKAFATCHVSVLNGTPTLLSQGAKALYAYEPAQGTEWWRVEERTSHSGGTRPVAGNGLVYVPTGWSQGQTLAIRPGAPGEVIDANDPNPSQGRLRVEWKSKRSTPRKPALTLKDDLLFGIEDGGIATCWDARTGSILWNERIGGNYSASPLLAGDRLYCFSEEGKTVVLAATREFRKLSENFLDDGFMASPAVSGDALYLRSRTHLYRLER